MTHAKYSGRTVSLPVFLPLLFLPMVLTGQRLQENVVALKSWATPLYWQPNQAEREAARNAVPQIQFSANAVSTGALTFVAITPCRLVDTRGAAGGFNGIAPFSGPAIPGGGTLTIPVQSATEAAANTTPAPCGVIPSIAQAYSFNVTVVPAAGGSVGYLSLWPAGSAQPVVATLNDTQGQVLANAAIVPAGTPSGGVSVYNAGPATADVVIDMNGYFAAPSDLSGNTAIGMGALVSNSSGINNTASGVGALSSNTAGDDNTAGGWRALGSNTTGSVDTAVGASALGSNTTGQQNTAIGSAALSSNTTGCCNTASGNAALYSNTTGSGNTADGNAALESNTGSSNTAVGSAALTFNTTGSGNTASGFEALQNNTTGSSNTASGSNALASNTLGGGNTASGTNALVYNTNGNYNTASGVDALQSNTTGSNNTASGTNALEFNITGSGNTASGDSALQNSTTGSNNIAIGLNAARNLGGSNSNNIHIGSQGRANDNGTIRIGGNTALGDPVAQTSFFVAGVNNVNLGGDTNAVGVLIDTTTGQLGVASSSRRYKEDIEDMGDASRDLMRLRPVTFRYKKPFADGSKPVQYGLIAEEVDEVYPDLVAHSADGQIETVKYQVLDSMLLNEVQKQQAEIGAQKEQLRRLEQQNVSLQERLDKLEAAMLAMPNATSASRVSGVAAVR